MIRGCAGAVSLPGNRGLLLDHLNRGRRGGGFGGRLLRLPDLVLGGTSVGRLLKYRPDVVLEALLYQRLSAH